VFRGEAAAEAAGEGESGVTGHLKGPLFHESFQSAEGRLSPRGSCGWTAFRRRGRPRHTTGLGHFQAAHVV